MIDPPKRKRRWFQFSLRTLMIVVTLLAVPCAYVGWQAKLVSERKAELDRVVRLRLVGKGSTDEANVIRWMRRLLGDQRIVSVWMPPGTTTQELDRIRALFPESKVTCENRFDWPAR